MFEINSLKKYITLLEYLFLYTLIFILFNLIFIPYSFTQTKSDDLSPLISEDEIQEQSLTTLKEQNTTTNTDTTSTTTKLSQDQLNYQKLFKSISSKKISTPSFVSLEQDLIFVLYKNYLYLYTPYRTSKFKIFKDENSILRKIRFFFSIFHAKSYKFLYTKNNIQGAYYFSVTENGFIPYFIFLPTNKIITFKDMRDYILSDKQEWLQYNNSSWLKSANFKKYISKNEVYITAGSGVNYWKNDGTKLDKNSIKLLEVKFKEFKNRTSKK